jgi:hypothetical protein
VLIVFNSNLKSCPNAAETEIQFCINKTMDSWMYSE